MRISDLQFEQGTLVKIKGMRPDYMDGNQLMRATKELAELVLVLQHQLNEVTGTVEEYEQMPCASLRTRMVGAKNSAVKKLEQLK